MNKSQSKENEFIYKIYFDGQTSGRCFEAGALDGKKYYNTALFSQKGFTGILVELTKNEYKKSKKNRPNDRTLNCIIGTKGVAQLKTSAILPFINSENPVGIFKVFTTGREYVQSVLLSEILQEGQQIDLFFIGC